MKITCPKCGHSAEVDDLVIPEGTTSVRCHACGTLFPLSRKTKESIEKWEWKQIVPCTVCNTEQDRHNQKDFAKSDQHCDNGRTSSTQPEASETETSCSNQEISKSSLNKGVLFLNSKDHSLSIRVKIQALITNFIGSKWYLVFIILIYILFVIIPVYYDVFYTIPEYAELNRSEGVFILNSKNKRGVQLGLITSHGKIFFTCRSPTPKSSNSPPVENEVLKSFVGKKAIILWHKRPMYIGSYANYLIELRVEGKIIISRSTMITSLELSKKCSLIAALFIMILFSVTYKINTRKYNIVKQNDPTVPSLHL